MSDSNKSLRILLSNDDGIHAPGLVALEKIARELSDDIWIVAPETEQSGAGHSLSINHPLRYREIDERRFAVSGTPTDCVVMAVKKIITGKPVDLVLSGVNRGSNLGEDITYSGTVAVAMEGTLLDIPSIAMSQCYADRAKPRWEVAEHFAPDIIRSLIAAGWSKGNLININFPDAPVKDVKGVQAVPQGKRQLDERLTECMDPKGRPYYWMDTIQGEKMLSQPGSDLALSEDGYVTVTPVCVDFTDYQQLEAIRTILEGHTLARTA